jgi:hypothetical protein
MKHWLVITTLLILGVNAEAQSRVRWDFATDKIPISRQGMDEHPGFKLAPGDNGALRLIATKSSYPYVKLGGYKFHAIKGEDIGRVDINMKVTPRGRIKDAKLRLAWKFKGMKQGGFIEVPVLTDGQFHTYNLDLTKSLDWAKGKAIKGASITLYPLYASDIEGAQIDLKHLWLELSPEADVRRLKNLAFQRFEELQKVVAVLQNKKIAVRGMEQLLQKTADALKVFKQSKTSVSEKLRLAAAAETAFKQAFTIIRSAQRYGILLNELSYMRQSMNFSCARKLRIDANAKTAVDTFAAKLDSLKILLKKGEFTGLKTMLDQLEKSKETTWNKLLATNVQQWQTGLSGMTYSRFGWLTSRKTGLLTFDATGNALMRDYFRNANGSLPQIQFFPITTEVVKNSGKVKDISWVSKEFEYDYIGTSDKKINWNVKWSLLAPGVVITTNSDKFNCYLNVGKSTNPSKILAIVNGRPKIIPVSQLNNFNTRKLSENWILLLFETNFPEVPCLITFGKRPDRISLGKRGIVVSRRGGVGSFGLSLPWGVRPLPSNFAQNWTSSAPGEIVAQCRQINSVMTAYPYKCEEYFSVSADRKYIDVVNVVEHLQLANDWNFKGEKIAPLPPVLAFAAAHKYGGSKHPIKLPGKAMNLNMWTKAGPYMACKGNMIAYSIPVPDLRTPCYLKMAEADPKRLKQIKRIQNRPNYHAMTKMPNAAPSGQMVFQPWCSLDTQFRADYGKDIKMQIITQLNQQDQLGGFSSNFGGNQVIERTEPFSGISYLVRGWRAKRLGIDIFGDTTTFAGCTFVSIYDYARFYGDWQLVRDNWSKLLRVLSVNIARSDWAIMGQDYNDFTMSHVIDMGADSWAAPVYMTKLAAAVGDRRTEDLTLYMSARQAVPLVAAFSKRPWDMAYANNWSWQNGVPEAGFPESGGIAGGAIWAKGITTYNFICGINIAQETVNLYRDFCPEAAKHLLYTTLEHFFPQWYDIKYVDKDAFPGHTKYVQKGGNLHNGIANIMFLRSALGDSYENLNRIYAAAMLEGTSDEGKLGKYVPAWPMDIFTCAFAARMLGDQAPCQLANWIPARLVDAVFYDSKQEAVMTFESNTPFTVNIISATLPKTIKINGQLLTETEYQFDSAAKNLRLKVNSSGTIRIALNYTGWVNPNQTIQVMSKRDTALTEEMKICQAERQKTETYLQDATENYALNQPVRLDLKPYFNMSFSQTPNGNNKLPYSWFGVKTLRPTKSGLYNITTGTQTYRGVPFTISADKNKGAIGLYGWQAKKMPRKAVLTKLNLRARKLYFLHGAFYDNNDAKVVARYVIHYTDGTHVVFKARSGLEIADWWDPRDLDNARLGTRVKVGVHVAGLYIAVWENTQYTAAGDVENAVVEQRELKTIDRIELESTGIDGALAVVAITADTL